MFSQRKEGARRHRFLTAYIYIYICTLSRGTEPDNGSRSSLFYAYTNTKSRL